MNLVLIACTLVPQLHGVEGDEDRVFLWPLGSGYSAYELRATYGQPEGSGLVHLHGGLDVSTKVAGSSRHSRTVYALEDGVVAQVYIDDEVNNHVSGLVIASKANPKRAFLYLHLDRDSIRLGKNDEVYMNQKLGRVIASDTITGVPHVHLSRLGGDFANEPWSSITSLSERNPLALLDPSVLGDTTAPVVETIDGLTLRVCDNEVDCSTSYAPVVVSAATGGQPRPLDVFACVIDSDGGPHPLAPYRLTLTVSDDPSQIFHLCLDGPLPKASALCYQIKRRTLPPQYDFFLVPTNGAADCSSPDSAHAWQAPVGKHTLELRVEDVAGVQVTKTIDVDVQSP